MRVVVVTLALPAPVAARAPAAAADAAQRFFVERTRIGIPAILFEEPISVVRLAEAIEGGQHVARYRVDGDVGDGDWRALVEGQTIGYCKLDRIDPTVRMARLRITIDEFVETVAPVTVRVFAAAP